MVGKSIRRIIFTLVLMKLMLASVLLCGERNGAVLLVIIIIIIIIIPAGPLQLGHISREQGQH